MKKTLILAASIAFGLMAQAAYDRLATLQVANDRELVAAADKVGEFTGHLMLGYMVSAQITGLECYGFFGPMRENAAMALGIYIDTAKVAKALEDDDEEVDPEFTLLYPVSWSPAEFRSNHVEAVSCEGLLKVPQETDDEDGDDVWYVGFSTDGKWAARSERPELVKKALAEVAEATKPLQGGIARFEISPSGIKLLQVTLDETAREINEKSEWTPSRKAEELKSIEESKRILGAFKVFSALAKVDAQGVALAYCGETVAGGYLDSFGCNPIEGRPLAKAATNAVLACQCGKDSGCGDLFRDYERTLAILARHGIKLDFLELVRKGADGAFTLDLPALFGYFKDPVTAEVIEKVNGDQLRKDLGGVREGQQYLERGPAQTLSFSLKGYSSVATPAERFAATLPEAAKVKPYIVGYLSLHSILRAVAPQIYAQDTSAESAQMKQMFAALPREGKGALAGMHWREGQKLLGVLRLSADEFKFVSKATVGMAMMMQGLMNSDGNDD